MKEKKEKLGLNKFKIAQLTNLISIKGGSNNSKINCGGTTSDTWGNGNGG